MIFVFEDKKSDLLSKLFMTAYKSCNFIYTEGNGNLVKEVTSIIKSTEERIVVFLDTIPDNKDTINIYNTLKRLSLKNDYRVIVMPIVCSEYYFICSLPSSMFVSRLGLDICLDKKYWKNSELVATSDKKFTKNFEKYCKLVLLKNVKDCAKHSRSNNDLYGFYYCKDCLCNSSDLFCEDKSLLEKAISYVSKYPVYPAKNYLGDCTICSIDKLWEIHRVLVDDFNIMANGYKECDNNHSYCNIAYINATF